MDNEEGEDATPPAMLLDFTKTSAVSPTFPSNVPITSYPTVNSLLHQQQTEVGVVNPSTGSLQPSMNDLGSIPLPDKLPQIPGLPTSSPARNETHDTTLKKFDPNSLFESSEASERDGDRDDRDDRRDDRRSDRPEVRQERSPDEGYRSGDNENNKSFVKPSIFNLPILSSCPPQ